MAELTIKQIARDLDLSIAAVSAALGTQSTSKVSAATASRVQAYARKVNYRPSLIGRSMRSQRLRQVGILVESDLGHRRFLPTVDLSAVFGLNDFLREREWQLNIIDDSGSRTGAKPLPRYLRENFLDGLVVSSSSGERDLVLDGDFTRFSIPAVFLNSAGKTNCIRINDRRGGVLGTRHLLDLGHKKILYLGTNSRHHSMAERESGYQKTMRAAGLKPLVYHLETGGAEGAQDYEHRVARRYQMGERFAGTFFRKERPTGIVCYDDGVALIAIKGLQDAGFFVPRDVSIVGFNDMPFVDMLTTPLTTLRTDHYAMGRLAGELLLRLIEKPGSNLPSPRIDPELIIRGSTRAMGNSKKPKA